MPKNKKKAKKELKIIWKTVDAPKEETTRIWNRVFDLLFEEMDKNSG